MTKKYSFGQMLLSLAKATLYVLLYYASQLITSLVVQIIYIASRGGAVSEKELGQFIENNTIEIVLASNAILIILIALISKIRKKTLSENCDVCPIGSGYFTTTIMGISSQFAISVVLTFMIAYRLFPESWINNYMSAPMTTTNASMLIKVLSMGIIAPIAEEIVFRGCIQKSFNESMPKWAGIILTSFIFAVMHGYEIQVIYAFIFGILISWIYSRFDSIVPTILFHIAFNMTSVLMPNISSYAMLMLGLGGIYVIIWGIRSICRSTVNGSYKSNHKNDKNDEV